MRRPTEWEAIAIIIGMVAIAGGLYSARSTESLILAIDKADHSDPAAFVGRSQNWDGTYANHYAVMLSQEINSSILIPDQ